MSTIQSSTEHLTLNADGSGKDIKFQANGVEKASISSAGAFTSPSIDATKLSGALPAIDGSALTSLTSSQMPTGSVIQVVQATGDTDPETATTSTTFVATGSYASITPSSTSSKILAMVNGGFLLCAAGSNGIAFAQLYRDGSDVGCPSMRVRNDGNVGEAPMSLCFLDSPNTTSSVTYKVYIKGNGGSIQLNNHEPQSCKVTLMEIAQ